MGDLRDHRGQVTAVTLDIGANDIDSCFTSGAVNEACAAQGLGKVSADLPRITGALRAAGGAHPRYAGMTYYDPFLAAWLMGADGRHEAAASVSLAEKFNEVMVAGLHQYGFRVANVARTCSTTQFTPTVAVPGLGQLPKNVAEVCASTWMCTRYQDVHANRAGHTVIAGVFERVLASHHR